jgi:hypothetical protein
MVAKETTVKFTFSDLEYNVHPLCGQRRVAQVTQVVLSWTTDDPVLDQDSPFLNYDVLGWQCNRDGSVDKRQNYPQCVIIPDRREMWLFLSKLAEQIDHPEIQAELARRLAKEIRETS